MNRKNDLVTDGTATVYSASSSFTSADVGKPFVIHNGANAGTYTITGFVDSTHITLNISLSSGSGISFTLAPLMTATYDGSPTPNDGVLENIDGYGVGVIYHDCNDGDGDSNNNDKKDTARYSAPSVVINEVLFYPDPNADTETSCVVS